MRTTIDVADTLLGRAKGLAEERHTTLSALVNEALAAYLALAPKRSRDAAFELLVRGRPGGRFPSPTDIADADDAEAAASLRIPQRKRRAAR